MSQQQIGGALNVEELCCLGDLNQNCSQEAKDLGPICDNRMQSYCARDLNRIRDNRCLDWCSQKRNGPVCDNLLLNLCKNNQNKPGILSEVYATKDLSHQTKEILSPISRGQALFTIIF